MAVIEVQGREVLLDDGDLALVMGFKWRIQRTPKSDLTYAITRVHPNGVVAMHRLILGCIGSPLCVDHINSNGLDNRRANLRSCTYAENARNARLQKRSTTGFKGVWRRPNKVSKPFTARIFTGGKAQYLGTFATAEEAHAAYVEAAKRLYGEFHRAA